MNHFIHLFIWVNVDFTKFALLAHVCPAKARLPHLAAPVAPKFSKASFVSLVWSQSSFFAITLHIEFKILLEFISLYNVINKDRI